MYEYTPYSVAFQDTGSENELSKSSTPVDQSENTLDPLMAIMKCSVLVLIVCVLLTQLLIPLLGSLLMDMLFALGVLQSRALNLGAPGPTASAAPQPPVQTSLREAQPQQQQVERNGNGNGSSIRTRLALQPQPQPMLSGANGGTHFGTMPRLPPNSLRPPTQTHMSSSTMPRNRSVALAAPTRVPTAAQRTVTLSAAEPFIATSDPFSEKEQPTRAVRRSGSGARIPSDQSSAPLLPHQTQRATRARTPPAAGRAPKPLSEDVQSIRSDHSRRSHSRAAAAADVPNSNATPSAFLKPIDASLNNFETFIDA